MANPRVVQPNDPPHLKAMFSVLGLSEIAGPRHEKQVVAMYAACGHPEVKDDETAWCAAGVGWALKQAGLPNTGSLMARSYVKYGKKLDLDHIWPRGAIIVEPRGAPPSGHVKLLLEDDGEFLLCIGANQANGKGGGVTITKSRKDFAIAARMPVYPAKPAPKPVEPEPPQPDDPGVEPAPVPEHVPWWKKPFVYLGGLLTSGLGIGGASVSLDAQFLWGLSAFTLLAFILFVVWVYAIPPRGKFVKGIF